MLHKILNMRSSKELVFSGYIVSFWVFVVIVLCIVSGQCDEAAGLGA